MRFAFVTLQVRDMEASLRFYRDLLGMEIARRFSPGPGTDVVFLSQGGLQLELICRQGVEPDAGGSFSLGFAVSDLDGELALLTAAGLTCGPVLRPAPRTRLSFCNDPDGNAVELIEEKTEE
ncbi:MAG: VOC family protein [Firmicutes bacterium]|nr:VOC family protein [Bacillota bacterium]